MKKHWFTYFILIVATLVATSCSKSMGDPILSTPTPWVIVVTATAGQPTQTVVLLSATPTLMPATPTLVATVASVPTITPTFAPADLVLDTAEQIRDFGRVIGWVSGGSDDVKGEFVQGAQISLNEDFVLKTLPSGDIFEFECMQYWVVNEKIVAKPVCESALVRFDTNSIVSKGSIGTLWLTNAVVGSDEEKWVEGFINEPCECPDGDCRDQ